MSKCLGCHNHIKKCTCDLDAHRSPVVMNSRIVPRTAYFWQAVVNNEPLAMTKLTIELVAERMYAARITG